MKLTREQVQEVRAGWADNIEDGDYNQNDRDLMVSLCDLALAALDATEGESAALLTAEDVRVYEKLLKQPLNTKPAVESLTKRPVMPAVPKRYDLEFYTAPNSEGDWCAMEENDNGDWVDRQCYFELRAYAARLEADYIRDVEALRAQLAALQAQRAQGER